MFPFPFELFSGASQATVGAPASTVKVKVLEQESHSSSSPKTNIFPSPS